jgi:hypothetical protein
LNGQGGRVDQSRAQTPALRYQTGVEIHRDDRVTYGGNAGTVVLVVEALTGKSEEDWLFERESLP